MKYINIFFQISYNKNPSNIISTQTVYRKDFHGEIEIFHRNPILYFIGSDTLNNSIYILMRKKSHTLKLNHILLIKKWPVIHNTSKLRNTSRRRDCKPIWDGAKYCLKIFPSKINIRFQRAPKKKHARKPDILRGNRRTRL